MDNEEKWTYFKNRPNDFIEIYSADTGDFQRLCAFLHVDTTILKFPWLNKSNYTIQDR